jgi:acetyltransferase-like isoleucine patch superfamily enzyme
LKEIKMVGEEFNKKYKRDIPLFEWSQGFLSRWIRAKKLGFGEGSSIYELSYVYNPENIKVGKNTWIGPFTLLDASGGALEIGDNCSISAGVQIYTHDSVKWAISGGKIGLSKAPVKIGNNCYIGPYAVISKGSVIPDGSIVKSHSLVRKGDITAEK